MKHGSKDIVDGYLSDAEQVEKKKIRLKENKMEGIDPSLVALLQKNGAYGADGNIMWNNPITLLIVLGFLTGGGRGIFGGDDRNGSSSADVATAASLAGTQAKLDCLQQGQTDALMAAHNTNMTNLFHSNEMSTQNGFNRLASALAECCCKLGIGQKEILCGQKEIINEICKQNGLLITAMTANTQRVVDVVNSHANVETQSKLTDCKAALSNCQQTKDIAELIAKCCSDGDGHGRGK